MVRRHSPNSLLRDYQSTVRESVLHHADSTGGRAHAKRAAELVGQFGYARSTWTNRATQLTKWFNFCEEQGVTPLVDSDAQVVAFIGYLSHEGRISPSSLPHYLSAISKYHEHHGRSSPTNSQLVSDLRQAYNRKHCRTKTTNIRIGCPAQLLQRIVQKGCDSSEDGIIASSCAAVVAYVFHLRSVSLEAISKNDLTVRPHCIERFVRRRKGKSHSRPLVLKYWRNTTWPCTHSPFILVRKWLRRVKQDVLFARTTPAGGLESALHTMLQNLDVVAPQGFSYSSHSLRIGAMNELLLLGCSKEIIMHRFDWTSARMIQTYIDSSVTLSSSSEWFFEELLPQSALRPQLQ
ncbi:Integrase/recombinase [Gracilaria domingensis]|nr:Integrase/recombinase [Gracilaria domingensis]